MSFVSQSILNVPRGDAEENIKIEGKQNLLFPLEPVILMTGLKVFVIPPNSKKKIKTAKN